MELLKICLLVSLCVGLTVGKCVFTRGGEWNACNDDHLLTRTEPLDANRSDQNPTEVGSEDQRCAASRTLARACVDTDCEYESRGLVTWSACDPATNTATATRRLDSGDGCPAQLTERRDCRVALRRRGPKGRRNGGKRRNNQRRRGPRPANRPGQEQPADEAPQQ